MQGAAASCASVTPARLLASDLRRLSIAWLRCCKNTIPPNSCAFKRTSHGCCDRGTLSKTDVLSVLLTACQADPGGGKGYLG